MQRVHADRFVSSSRPSVVAVRDPMAADAGSEDLIRAGRQQHERARVHRFTRRRHRQPHPCEGCDILSVDAAQLM